MIASRKGLLAGAFAGFVAAAAKWEGNITVAASSILFGAAIGWLIGHQIGKRRKPMSEKPK